MPQLIYVGPFDAVEVDGLPGPIKPNEPINVPADLAGSAPVTDVIEGMEVTTDWGSGLLAQPSNWQVYVAPVVAAKKSTASTAPADPSQEG